MGSEINNSEIGEAILKGLCGLIPTLGAAGAEAISLKFRSYEKKRVHALFDALAKGSKHLSNDLIESEDFLFCFIATVRAVERSRRMDKIAFYANLLLNGASGQIAGGIDDFETMLQLLDDLSMEELRILFALVAAFPEGRPYGRKVMEVIEESTIDKAQALAACGRLFSKGLLNMTVGGGGGLNDSVSMSWWLNPRVYQFHKLVREYSFPNMQ